MLIKIKIKVLKKLPARALSQLLRIIIASYWSSFTDLTLQLATESKGEYIANNIINEDTV